MCLHRGPGRAPAKCCLILHLGQPVTYFSSHGVQSRNEKRDENKTRSLPGRYGQSGPGPQVETEIKCGRQTLILSSVREWQRKAEGEGGKPWNLGHLDVHLDVEKGVKPVFIIGRDEAQPQNNICKKKPLCQHIPTNISLGLLAARLNWFYLADMYRS